MPNYATRQELANYIDPDADYPTPPDNAGVLLRIASDLVADAISGAVYEVDADDLPVDGRYRDAVRRATCEQASAWSLNGIDPRRGAAGLKPIVTTKSLNGASTSYGQSAPVQQAIVDLARGTVLTSQAFGILDRAGLITSSVQTGTPYAGNVIDERPYDPTTGRLIS